MTRLGKIARRIVGKIKKTQTTASTKADAESGRDGPARHDMTETTRCICEMRCGSAFGSGNRDFHGNTCSEKS